MACAKLTTVSILASLFLSSHCLYSPSPGERLALVGVQWRRFSFDYFITDGESITYFGNSVLDFFILKLSCWRKLSSAHPCFTVLQNSPGLRQWPVLPHALLKVDPVSLHEKSHNEWILLGIVLWFLQLFKRDIPSWISVTTTKLHSHYTGVKNYTKPHSVLGGQVCTHCIRECVILAQVP